MEFCHLGKHFSIKCYSFLLECADEFAVRESEWANSRIDLDAPKSPEIILFLAAMGERILSGMNNSLTSLALLLAPSETIPFYLFEDFSPSLE